MKRGAPFGTSFSFPFTVTVTAVEVVVFTLPFPLPCSLLCALPWASTNAASMSALDFAMSRCCAASASVAAMRPSVPSTACNAPPPNTQQASDAVTPFSFTSVC